MKITINEKEVTLKQTFRTAKLYEANTKESFGTNITTSNLILYFYCTVLGSDPSLMIDFDWFIDNVLDTNPNILNEFTNWFMNVNNLNEKLKGEPQKTEKKKRSKKTK